MPSVDSVHFVGSINVSNAASTNGRPGNPSRGLLILSNAGANRISIALSTENPKDAAGGDVFPTAVLDAGITLMPNTAPLVLEGYAGAFSAIAATAATLLSVTEL